MNETEKDTWLLRARNAFDMSTSFYDTNYRNDIEDSIKLFNSEHPSDSKYHKGSYMYRSKLFRPKTRSAIRKNEAAATAAFFSGMDAFNITPLDENDPEGAEAAKLLTAIMDYRLNNSIPWFQTVIGALQDAQKTGIVCSRNYWSYKTVQQKRQNMDEDGPVLINGKPTFTVEEKVVEDKPVVKLIPIDNIRFHPGADWTDPVNTSPFFIEMIPMYFYEIKNRMKEGDEKTGESKWTPYTKDQILQCKITEENSTQKVRNHNRQDGRTEDVPEFHDYTQIWVHRNIINVSGVDYVYYTLGTKYRLSDPVKLSDEVWHGMRDYTIGCVILETHKTIPQGVAQIGRPLQEEANEIVNTRLDNVKLVLNKRWIAKRGAEVDLQSLVRNVPGSVTMTQNPADVVPVEFQDVTASSYAEQDRINLDHDELVGNFSQGSVQSNRKLNETVGGMGMLNASAGLMSDYLLRTFAETWIEPTLKQLVMLECKYETDETIVKVAAKQAKIMPRPGDNDKINRLFSQNLLVKVDVGLGASNPQHRMERFLFGVSKFAEISQINSPYLDIFAIGQELWSYLGYKSGDRFMTFDESNEDPKYIQLTKTIEQLQQALQMKENETQEKLQIENLKQQNENVRTDKKINADLIKEDMKADNVLNIEQVKAAIQMVNNAANRTASTKS